MNRRSYILPKSSRLICERLSLALVLACASTAGEAFAGDMFAPDSPYFDQARCDALGEGFHVLAGSNACIKISGYIAAGAAFAAPAAKSSDPFSPKASVGFSAETAAGEVRLDTPLGPGRLYVQIGHDAYPP